MGPVGLPNHRLASSLGLFGLHEHGPRRCVRGHLSVGRAARPDGDGSAEGAITLSGADRGRR